MRRKPPESFLVTVRLPDTASAERAGAEAFEAGASGLEERDEADGGITLLVYAPAAAAQAVRAALVRVAPQATSEAEALAETDWSDAWREGLEPVVVGTRLVVRPSWLAAPAAPAEAGSPRSELVIDPGQAFGTGGHVSTRLALEWIEALSHRRDATREQDPTGLGRRVLDVGTGTGVLALAALALGAERAVGFDLDPASGAAARQWAAENGLADRFSVFVGPVEALAANDFDCLVANLLKSELLPLAAALAAVTAPGARAVFSGLLASERDEVLAALGAAGFDEGEERTAVDPNGDGWISLLMTRASAPAIIRA